VRYSKCWPLNVGSGVTFDQFGAAARCRLYPRKADIRTACVYEYAL
jgi:hypothetical protein